MPVTGCITIIITRARAIPILTRSTPKNVGNLAQVCAYQMNSRASMQTGPIVYQGIMYVTNETHTAAINAATCEKIWTHDWQPRDRMVWGNNRGVAIKDGYVVRGTNDGYLFCAGFRQW